MSHTILRKTASVLVVSDSATVRSEIARSLRNLGFTKLETCSRVRDARNFLRQDHYDWVITTLISREEENGITLLEYCRQKSEENSSMVSFFVEKDEENFLPIAFELGLFSWHPAVFSPEALKRSFEELLRLFMIYGGSSYKIAAQYLSKYFKERKNYDGIINVYQSLNDNMPGDPSLLFGLAEAFFASNRRGEAISILTNIAFLDANLKNKCNELLSKYSHEETNIDMEFVGATAGINTVVVVDSDEQVVKTVTAMLYELGVENVYSFNDGASAWLWMRKNEEPDLILQEWRLPELNGFALLQRIRSYNFNRCSIVIMSSQLKKQDIPLLTEMSVSNVIKKPFGHKEFLLALRWTLSQEKNPTEQKALEGKIIRLLNMGKIDEARSAKASYFADKKVSEERRAIMNAHFMYFDGDFEEARDQLVEALKSLKGESLIAINLLGKCLVKLGDHSSALKCFEKAQSLSPLNVQRLCDIAEMKMEDPDESEAEKLMSKAEKIDSTHAGVIGTKTKTALLKKNLKDARDLMAKVDSRADIVSYMNNKAVAMIRADQHSEAIQLYNRVIDALPPRETELRSIVHYNMGLGYARANMLPESFRCLETALKFDSKKVKKRILSLRERVDKAIKTNTPLELKLKSNENEYSEDLDYMNMKQKDLASRFNLNIPAVKITPGDFCLHKVYYFAGELDEDSRVFLKKIFSSKKKSKKMRSSTNKKSVA